MSEPDEKDFKILAELCINARSTASEIGGKTDLSKNTVNNRIKDLEKSGIIKGYSTLIDVFGLGYLGYRLYMQLQYADNNKEEEMMDHLKDSPLTWWCSHTKGRFDLCSLFWSKTPHQFVELWNDLKLRYRPYIKEAVVVPYYGFIQCGVPSTKRISSNNAFLGNADLPKIDQTDRNILWLLSSNARLPLSKIAKAVGMTDGAVKHRITQLVQNKVIVGFRPLVDMNRLGYRYYKVDLNLRSLEKQKRIEQFILDDENVFRVVRSAGWADLEMGVYSKTPEALYRMLDRIRDEFPDELRDHGFFEFSQMAKESFMPSF